MLHDATSFLSPLQSALSRLHNSNFEFYLTGSRHFGGARQDSDWDFIAAHNKEIKDFLLSLGFERNEHVQLYLDPMTTEVVTLYLCSCSLAQEASESGLVYHRDDCMKIDVQLCHDMENKIKIRNLLKETFKRVSFPGNKYQRNAIWELTYKLLK